MNYIYGINPKTGQMEMGANVMGHWMPRVSLDYNYAQKLKNNISQAPMQSMINRNQQPYQYNAPSAQQLFPSVGNPMMGNMQSPFSGMFGGMTSPNMGSPNMGTQGQYGAGRFLGGNTGLLGSSSTSMLGT